MTPTEKEIATEFEKVANKKKINLELVDEKWLAHMMGAMMMCDFKTRKLFQYAVEHILTTIPKWAH